MSESSTTPDSPDIDTTVEEWQPEPRTWTWNDLFTAPMLAFKPKCMLISALTLFVLMALCMGWGRLLSGVADSGILTVVVSVIGILIGSIVFTLGAALVAVFMKADLLDDEFLSFGEALGQYRGRILPAILVPSFLVATVVGFALVIYVGMLAVSIPYAGPILYIVLYPFAYLFALLGVLVSIAVVLSVFVMPSIIAIRKHGWFDNVIDTFEAVGTKPHVIILNLALTLLMAFVALGIAHGGMSALSRAASHAPGVGPAATEYRAQEVKESVRPWVSPWQVDEGFTGYNQMITGFSSGLLFDADENNPATSSFYSGTGFIVGIWQSILLIIIAGYALNVTIAGGMLTYLFVREDDYWDDENLEDLDQLAKELEEEAKAEAAKAEAEAKAAGAAAPSAEASQPEAPATDATPPTGEAESAEQKNSPEQGDDAAEGAANDESKQDDASPEKDGDASASDENTDTDDEQKKS